MRRSENYIKLQFVLDHICTTTKNKKLKKISSKNLNVEKQSNHQHFSFSCGLDEYDVTKSAIQKALNG